MAAPAGAAATALMARTASNTPPMPVGGRAPALSVGSPRKSTSASIIFEHAVGGGQQLAEVGEQNLVHACCVLGQHLAVALDGVDRRAQIVAELRGIENDLAAGALVRQNRLQQGMQRVAGAADSLQIGEVGVERRATLASSIRMSV